jgi:hypothetical protein
MLCGFRAVSFGGALLLSLSKKGLDYLCKNFQEFKNKIDVTLD